MDFEEEIKAEAQLRCDLNIDPIVGLEAKRAFIAGSEKLLELQNKNAILYSVGRDQDQIDFGLWIAKNALTAGYHQDLWCMEGIEMTTKQLFYEYKKRKI